MNARPRSPDQIPIGELERVLLYIVNLKFPYELWPEGIPESEQESFFRRLRERTSKYWPGLWVAANQGESAEQINERVQWVVRKMRTYLQRFWREPDPRARDWYIQRAREFYQKLFALPKTSSVRDEAENARSMDELRNALYRVNIEAENLLDEPPLGNPIEDALYALQQRALIPSRRPLFCPNPRCAKPYFLSEKKGKKFCSTECALPALLASKFKSRTNEGPRRRYTRNPKGGR